MRSGKENMEIEELCSKSGLGKPSIYRYIRMGLLRKPTKFGFRQSVFDEDHLKVLQKIRRLREQEGMSLPKIRDLLNVKQPGQDGTSQVASQRKKEQIMDKAITLFSKNGFTETKVSDITDALGVAKGTFYLYFRSKRDLFLECIGRLTMIVIPKELWEDVRKERDFIQRQRIKLKYFLQAFPTFSGILNLLRLSFQSDDQGMASKARDTYKILAGPLMKDLDRAITDKEAREVNAEVVSLLLLGMAESLGYLMMMDSRYSLEEGAEILLDLMWKGLLVSNPEEPKEKGGSWNVRDLKGVVVHIKDILIGGNSYFTGILGEGEIRVSMRDVVRIQMRKSEEVLRAVVSIRNGEQITLNIDGRVPVSGKSMFGEYSIPLERISDISARLESEQDLNVDISINP
jgi:AcrR family transcriptional regulator/predicted DNA-binding transcriptional regulator AlpA